MGGGGGGFLGNKTVTPTPVYHQLKARHANTAPKSSGVV